VRFEFGEHLIDVDRRELFRRGEPIALEPQVFDLLVHLVQHRDKVVSRDDLIAAVWGGRIVSDSAVTTRLNAVRRAVGDSGTTQAVIRTVMRKGVRFVAEVQEHDVVAPTPWLVQQRGPEAVSQTTASILVLAFRNGTGDPAQEYLTDAVTSDLTVDLSRMRDIVVISAATALAYKDTALDIRQIARELGVRYLVVGVIARTGDLVRTNVQLLDANSGVQLWGDRFEHEFADLSGLENTITGRIAASLNIQLIRAEGRRAERAPQPDALDLRLRASSLFYSAVTPRNTLATRVLLESAVALDPTSAEAWARLAHIIATDHLNQWNNTGRDHLRDAENAAHKAMSLDPNLALAHFANGLIQRARGAHHAALEAFRRATELDRNFATAYAQQGNQFTLVGCPAKAHPFVEQAIRLSPHDPAIGVFQWFIGRANFFAERYDQAILWLRKSVETRPNVWYNRLYLVSAYAHSAMPQAAVGALDEFNRRFPAPVCTLAVVRAWESATPNDHPTVVAAREKFHEGLLRTGLAEE
jgi:TolB-like protein/Tfp pilus assembly protein PilF